MSLQKKSYPYQGLVGKKILEHVMPLVEKRGLVEGRLIQDWHHIVGKKWALWSVPEKITFLSKKRCEGRLTLHVWGGAALNLQHATPVLVERVNRYFGYNCVEKILFKQMVVLQNTPLKAATPPPCKQTVPPCVQHTLESISSPRLQRALVDLAGVFFNPL